MKIQLLGDEQARLARRPTKNLEAYNSYLLGRHFLDRLNEDDFNKAIGYFEQATLKDPDYALAFVSLGNCYAFLGHDGYIVPKEGYAKARSAALKAIDLDNTLGDAHALLGLIKHVFEWDLRGAELEFQRAVKLSPNIRDIYQSYSLYLAEAGRFSESIAGYRRALELEPASPANLYNLGQNGYCTAGRFDEAIVLLKRSLEMDPNFYYARLFLAVNYALNGIYAEAIARADQLIATQPRTEDPNLLGFIGWVYAVSGKQEIARKHLNLLLDLRQRRYFDGYYIAVIHAGLGEKDIAFEWLKRGCEERACCMIYLKTDPVMKNLRSDPRYKEILRKMGWEK
jgi:tetratricopeptide (TPR) repeat protein